MSHPPVTLYGFPIFSLVPTFLILFAIILIRYFIFAGSFYLYFQKNYKKTSPAQIRSEIFYSVLSSLIFAGAGILVVELWISGRALIYEEIKSYSYFILSIFIAMLIHETYFYFTHILFHKKWALKKFHFVHHLSNPPTPWAAFSFHWIEGIIQAAFLPLLVLILPIHPIALLIFLTIMTVLGVTNHLGFSDRKSFRKVFIDSFHHGVHHKDFNCNYGLYFTFWDKILKTEKI